MKPRAHPGTQGSRDATQGSRGATQGSRGTTYGTRGTTRGTRGTTLGTRGATQGTRGATQGRRGTAQGTRGATQGTSAITQGTRATTQGTRGATQGSRGTTQGGGLALKKRSPLVLCRWQMAALPARCSPLPRYAILEPGGGARSVVPPKGIPTHTIDSTPQDRRETTHSGTTPGKQNPQEAPLSPKNQVRSLPGRA